MAKQISYRTKIGTRLEFPGGSAILTGTTRSHVEWLLDLPPSVNIDRVAGINGEPDVIYLTHSPEAGSLKN